MSKFSFDANKVAPRIPLEAIPREKCGWMRAIIIESATVPVKAPKKGELVNLTFEIIDDGELKGRKVWERYNTTNSNPVAERIAQEQISAICHATNVLVVKDTAQLHNIPLEIKVGYEEERIDAVTKQEYSARNNIKDYRPVDGGAPASSAAAAPGWAKKSTPAPAAAEEQPAQEAAAEPDSRVFWVVVDGKTIEMTGIEIAENVAQGMPLDTSAMLQDESDWKTVADYGFDAPAEEKAATPPPPTKVAPKPVPAPAKPAVPAAPAGKGALPWMTKKK